LGPAMGRRRTFLGAPASLSSRLFAYRALAVDALIGVAAGDIAVAFSRSCDSPNSTLADAEVFLWIARLSLARAGARRQLRRAGRRSCCSGTDAGARLQQSAPRRSSADWRRAQLRLRSWRCSATPNRSSGQSHQRLKRRPGNRPSARLHVTLGLTL
jgi:hypothetical protein